MTAARAALLALLAAAPARASAPRALLYAPDARALDWGALRGLAGGARARFTLALAPDDVPDAERAWLREAAATGRLELALRLPRDPLVPLLTRARPGAFIERLAEERALFKAVFGAEPKGFVAAGALLDAPARAAVASQGFAWTAAGDGPGPWRCEGGLAAVPLHALSAPEATRPPDAGGLAVDETATLAAGQGAPMFEALLRAGGWASVSDSLPAAGAFAAAPSTWPAWAGAEAWAQGPEAQRAGRLYEDAAGAVDRYENSGRASLSRLDQAGAALDRAAAAVNFRPGAGAALILDDLKAVYEAVGEDVPDEAGGTAELSAAPLERGVSFTAPASASTAPWAPLGLRVERDGPDVSVTITLRALEADKGAPLGFAGAWAELYIAVNSLAGSGSTRLLNGRRPVLRSRDGWEFAVTAAPDGARLWRVGAYEPALAAELRASADPAARELRLTLPGRRLRGNPAGWGFLLITGPAGKDGPLAVLGDADEQRALERPGPPPVLKAARLEPRQRAD